MHGRTRTAFRLRASTATACAALALAIAACSHGSTSQTSTNASNSGASSAPFVGTRPGAAGPRPAHPSDNYRLAEIAVDRLGGSSAPNAPVVTGVSVVGAYGLTVYRLGTSSQELLSIKENGAWRPLGTDVFYPDGRGLVHFGLSPELASRLIAGLQAPPAR